MVPMKNFLYKTFLFFVPVVLSIIVMELVIRSYPNVYKYKQSYLTSHKDEIEVLILGHSQLQSGIIPENFNLNCFSFAIDGQSLRYDLEIYEKFGDQLPNLKYVVLAIANFSLYFDMSRENVTSNRTVNYPIYLGLKSDEIPFYKKFECSSPGFQDKLKFILLKSYTSETRMTCLPLGNSTDTSRGVLEHNSWISKAAAECTWQLNCITSGDKIKLQNKERLLKLIEKCKSKGIKVILTTPPVATIYHTSIDAKIKTQLVETFNFCNDLSNNFKNVFYINLYNSPEFSDVDYSNPTHLNKDGALKFTKLVNDLITTNETRSGFKPTYKN
jgi:hypothetical protein